MRSIKQTGRIPAVNEDVFLFGDRERTGRFVGMRSDLPEGCTVSLAGDTAYFGRQGDYALRTDEVFAVQDNPPSDYGYSNAEVPKVNAVSDLKKAAAMISETMTPYDDKMDLEAARWRAHQLADSIMGFCQYKPDAHDAAALHMLLTVADRDMIPSTADGEIRSLLIVNAQKGKFGDIQIDESKSTLHIIIHVLDHLLAPRVFTYSPPTGEQSKEITERAIKAMKDQYGVVPMVLPRGTMEQLTKHTCGFYYGPGSNFCGWCGEPVKDRKIGLGEVVGTPQDQNDRVNIKIPRHDKYVCLTDDVKYDVVGYVAGKFTGIPPDVYAGVAEQANRQNEKMLAWPKNLPAKCGQCDEPFNEHVRRVHTQDGKWLCPACAIANNTAPIECNCKSLLYGHDPGCPLSDGSK